MPFGWGSGHGVNIEIYVDLHDSEHFIIKYNYFVFSSSYTK